MGGLGSLLGWFSSLAAVNDYRSSGGGDTDRPVEVESVRYWPASTTAFIFVLWLLQFMLPVVIVARIFGLRGLTLRGANARAVLLAGSLLGQRTLAVSDRALHLEQNGRPELELPLARVAGLELSESWLTQGIVVHSPALPGGRLKLWVEDPAAVADAIQQAAAGDGEAK